MLADLAAACAALPTRAEVSQGFKALSILFAEPLPRPRKRHPKPYRVSTGQRLQWHGGRSIWA